MKHNMQNISGNVLIRQLDAHDIEQIRQWRNDSNNTKYLRKLPYITEKMQKQWYANYLNDEDEMTFAIVENFELNRVVGSLSIYNFQEDNVEFGKILIGDNEAHGKQVGFNAIVAVAELVFMKLGKSEMILHVYAENIAARRVYEKVGFVYSDSRRVDDMEEYLMILKKEEFYRRYENA